MDRFVQRGGTFFRRVEDVRSVAALRALAVVIVAVPSSYKSPIRYNEQAPLHHPFDCFIANGSYQ